MLLLFSGAGGGGGSIASGLTFELWTNLGSGGTGPGSAWHDISSDVIISSFSYDYGLSGNRPSDSLASSGTLRYSLKNGTNNSGGIEGWYSPLHASKRTGWGVGIEQFLWMTANSAVSITSMTRSGSTVTVTTSAAHNLYSNALVKIEGANQSDYNWIWRVAVTGTTTFTFNIGGLTPASPATGTMTVTLGYMRMWSRVDTIDPEPGRNFRRVHVTAYDRARDLIDADLRDVSLQVNKTESECLSAIFAALDPSVAPRGQNMDDGIDQVPYALDDLGDGARCGSVCAEILRSSYGLGFVIEDGTFRYISRNTRATASAAYTIPRVVQMDVAQSVSRVYNSIRTITHPRTVDTNDITLWQATGDPVFVPAGTTIEVSAAFRNPDNTLQLIGAASTLALVASTDYVANTQADNLGTDLTASVTVSPAVRASKVQFAISNASASAAYMTTLQIRGKGVYDVGEREFTSESPQSYGLRSFTLDLPYQNSDATGQQIGDFIRDQYESIGTQIGQVTMRPPTLDVLNQHISLEVGQVVTVPSETTTGLSTTGAMILGVSVTALSDDVFEIRWLLGPKITLSNPGVPTSLAMSNLTDGDVRASWVNTTAGSYTQVYVDNVYRGTAGIGATTFDINNLSRATDYDVKVRHMFFGLPSTFSSDVTARPHIEATGGTIVDLGGFRTHTFTSNANLVVSAAGRYDIYLRAGGGGGGGTASIAGVNHFGGGGGAGGFIYLPDETEPAGTYAVVIGSGGTGGGDGNEVPGGSGVTGGNTTYRSNTALGGGPGAGGGAGANGGTGGCGGGATGSPAASNGTGGAGSQGGNGGNGSTLVSGSQGGGGGGAGGNGTTGTGGTSGTGGAGAPFFGTTYGVGGNGGATTGGAAGGANTGDGGDGGHATPSGGGFQGGSGIAIFRYPI